VILDAVWVYWTLQGRNYKSLRQPHWVAPQITVTTAHVNYSVLISRCLVAASNSGHFPSSGVAYWLGPQLPAFHFSQLQFSADSTNNSRVRVRVRGTSRLAVYSQSIHFGTKPLETHDQSFFLQLNRCVRSLYVISSLTRRWICLFVVKCTYRTYRMLKFIHSG
jgi:hypothetical protein